MSLASVSAMQGLVVSAQNNWSTFQRAYSSDGNCGSAQVGNLQAAMSALSQLVPMLQSYGGYAKSYASQLASTLNAASGQPPSVSQGFHCANPPYVNAVGGALPFALSGYQAAVQQVAQMQGQTPRSISIPAGSSATMTVAVLGWPYSARPIAPQVKTLLSVQGLSVQSVDDTGQSDAFGNPLYTVKVVGTGTLTGAPYGGQIAAAAGPAAAGYNVVICNASFNVGSGCAGVSSFVDTTTNPANIIPIKVTPTPAPAPKPSPLPIPIHLGPYPQPQPAPLPIPVRFPAPAPPVHTAVPAPVPGATPISATGPVGDGNTADTGGGFPVVPVALGALALGAGALFLLHK
jgi:hypothetical protein